MSLESSLEKLQVDNPDLEILHKAEKQLKNGHDEAALTTKLVALIKLERYQSAFDVIRKTASEHPVEAAYVYYKLGKIDLLRELALKSSLPPVQLALVQAEYRIGNFSAAEHILEKINVQDEDVPVILQAIRASRGLDVEGDSFEALFAKAYSLLYKDPQQALEVLSEAKQVAGDEYDSESVLVQAALAQSLAGHQDEAKKLLEQLSQSSDQSIAQVVENNLLSFEPVPETAEECQEMLRKYYSSDFSNATATQAAIFTLNKLILQARAGRKIGSIANRHTEMYPKSLAPRVLALQSNSLKHLRSELSKNPLDVGLALALVTKLPANEGANVVIELCAALAAADKKADLTPGLAGLLVASYKVRGTPEKIPQILRLFPLEDAETARSLASSDNSSDVEKAFEYFANGCDNYMEKAGGLLLTKPQAFEPPTTVPSIAELIAEIDTAAIESAGMTPFIQRRKVTSQPTIRKKRSGKPKLPKEYDASKQPDPERWMAKMDRSTYKRKNKKGGASQGASQGATTAPATAANPGPIVAPAKKNKKGKKGKK